MINEKVPVTTAALTGLDGTGTTADLTGGELATTGVVARFTPNLKGPRLLIILYMLYHFKRD